MATRRVNTSAAKTPLNEDDTTLSPDVKSNISPAVPASVIYKLLGFTFAMITFPIGSYFLSVNLLFGGNSTYAGGLAALVANVVLIGYVVVAFNDDKSEREAAIEEEKKSR
ncbi:vacuolar ATPase assembly integral membrane protein VMA21 [Sphaerulina musiva SO2202]|uniref:Vacuolar ATPase assembly integral membrane protein VMA21 n=1 Tax=Sphaerulina musiva (strain SO2202) TaxID=692275 RepID=N1QE46_SPHMS|nr:vacuolar ATPase assembly integral membrane protein VMA21 [Sphaerulina musiva SO2202]EMF10601.1 vacuolar ATPase assembly integral membrane protein VMA21 [Sphaerulina musiva SO2202]